MGNKLYQYQGCGLDNVYLQNGYELVETKYGKGVRIHDVPGLHAAIAKAIVAKPASMTDREADFIRSELDLVQESLDGLLGRSTLAVAHWADGKIVVSVVS